MKELPMSYGTRIPGPPILDDSAYVPLRDPVLSLILPEGRDMDPGAPGLGGYSEAAPALAGYSDSAAAGPDADSDDDIPDGYMGAPQVQVNGRLFVPPPVRFRNGPAQPQPPSAPNGAPAMFLKKPNPNDPNSVGTNGQNRILVKKSPLYKNEEMTKDVKYIRDLSALRDKYQVELGARVHRRGQLFDTKSIKKHFRDKKNYEIGNASLGKNRNNVQFYPTRDWIEGGLIWVCVPHPVTDRPVFYSHVGKVDRFHHTSMTAGGDVIGAGEWIIANGKLLKISANSGHYRPTIDFLYRAVLHMAAAFQGKTTVLLYDSQDDKWVDYPILEFVRKPSNGGRYHTHPQALTQ
jgi:hypothetical protein